MICRSGLSIKATDNGVNEMKKITDKGEALKAYGKVLPTALKFDIVFDAFESMDEVKAANALPKDKELLSMINGRLKATATTAARNVAIEQAGIVKPTAENDPQLRLRETAKLLQTNGESEESARAIASQVLGIIWED